MDILKMNHINSLPHPLYIRTWGSKILWPLHEICVETGCLKFDVCGKLQPSHISDIAEFIDSDNNKHDPETFYI